jgi:DNA modification methylase
MSRWRIVTGDLRDGVLSEFEDGYFHGVLCDPPYGFSPDGRARTWDDLERGKGRGFMAKEWDAAVPGASFWLRVRRVCKPGAHLLAFGGTRTYHRLACAVEDAGFEIRDMIEWLYSSGFPKSTTISHHLPPDDAARWTGYGTALKPAHEPIVLARNPPDGTIANNVLTHGCGGLAIDASRVAYASDADREALAKSVELVRAKGGVRDNSWANHSDLSGENPASEKGRWPANVLLDEAAAEMLDAQQNEQASRFFYVPKTSRREREAGLDDVEPVTPAETLHRKPDSAGLNSPRAGANRTAMTRNTHPTVKPIALATYLARLILPPKTPNHSRRIFVPFCGSGSEMIGALLAGWDEVVGIELSEEYANIARKRIRYHLAQSQIQPTLFDE